ncbi:MAG: protein-L-isoaspartate O-methyltransferase family protein [Nitrososphaerales archaeon]
MVPNFDIKESRDQLILSLKSEGILKSKLVEDAIRAVPRERFLWKGTPNFLAYADEPQPLGRTGQTISAPHMVVMMLEELELKSELRVLEIGTGSGYNAALVGWITSQGRKKTDSRLVFSIERDLELVEFAKRNIESVGLGSLVEIIAGDGSLGYPPGSEMELYDRILVTAGAPKVPSFLKKQLKTDGILEVPVGGSTYQKLLKIIKKNPKDGKQAFEETKLVDCMFVPLVGQDAHSPVC